MRVGGGFLSLLLSVNPLSSLPSAFRLHCLFLIHSLSTNPSSSSSSIRNGRETSAVGMLDINLFREDKGGNPEIIRESQRRRFADVAIVDEIIRLDQEWRKRTSFSLSFLFVDVVLKVLLHFMA
uniref:Serine-tRNA synthetase type1 N-terminal domain-containing protein n=1 Tax=Opuntia streptacantha TaxID=393608 RepID=A0A7C9D1M0_OPUST